MTEIDCGECELDGFDIDGNDICTYKSGTSCVKFEKIIMEALSEKDKEIERLKALLDGSCEETRQAWCLIQQLIEKHEELKTPTGGEE